MANLVEQTSFLTLSCFFEPLAPFVARIADFLSSGTMSKWPMERGPLDVRRVYFPRPKRGGSKPLKVALWSPANKPECTMLYADSEDGWGHFVAKLSQAASALESISIRTTLPEEEWGVQEVIYRKGGTYDAARRLRWLQEEDGYTFFKSGEPLPFEHIEPKSKNWVRSRTDVFRYVSNVGIDLEDERFWKSNEDAVYINEVWPSNQDRLKGTDQLRVWWR